MRKINALRAIIITLSIIPATVAYSHDIWLHPTQFSLSKGDTLDVYQVVGHDLDIEVILPLRKELTKRFELITPSGSVDLLSELPDESRLLLKGKLDFEGLALLTMEHDFLKVEFSSEKFSEYLKHEEFKNIEKLRDRMGRRPKQRERYARTLKSLIQVGKIADGELHKQVLGQKIEILLLQNPYLLDPGDDLDVQVLFDGKPLADKLVWILNGELKRLVSKSKSHTNTHGIARFNLEREGFWLIRVVHLLPCSDRADANWESYWSSFTFSIQ